MIFFLLRSFTFGLILLTQGLYLISFMLDLFCKQKNIYVVLFFKAITVAIYLIICPYRAKMFTIRCEEN